MLNFLRYDASHALLPHCPTASHPSTASSLHCFSAPLYFSAAVLLRCFAPPLLCSPAASLPRCFAPPLHRTSAPKLLRPPLLHRPIALHSSSCFAAYCRLGCLSTALLHWPTTLIHCLNAQLGTAPLPHCATASALNFLTAPLHSTALLPQRPDP